MNRIRLLFLGVIIFNISSVFGQIPADSIHIKRKFGTVFIQNDKKLTSKEILLVTKKSSEAYKQMKIAKSNSNMSSALGFVGGLMAGFSLGTVLATEKPNWTVGGIGVGFMAISIPFSIAYTKHAKKAVEIYNNELRCR